MSSHHFRPIQYFSVTLCATYILLGSGVIFGRYTSEINILLLIIAGMMMPFLISLWMMGRSRSISLIKEYTARIFCLNRISLPMLPLLFTLMPAVVIFSITISTALEGSPLQYRFAVEGLTVAGYMFPLLLLLLATFFEELGWRSYALDSLMSRFNVLNASIIFSLLWVLWYVPFIFVQSHYQNLTLQDNLWWAANFILCLVPLGIIQTWIWVRNGKSIIAATLFHASIRISQALFIMSQTAQFIQTMALFAMMLTIICFDQKTYPQSLVTESALLKDRSPIERVSRVAIQPPDLILR